MFKQAQNTPSFQFLSFLLLIVTVPLTITTYLYNRSDLPKYSVLVILGTVFIVASLIISLYSLYKNPEKNGKLTLEFDTVFDPLVFIFLLTAVISTVFSLNPYVSYHGQYERQIGLLTYIYLFLIYYFSSRVFNSEKRIKQTIFIIEMTAVIAAVYAIIQNAGWDPFEIQPIADKRPVSTMGNSVFAGGFMAMVLPFSLLNISGKSKVFLKALFPLLILTGIVVTKTRSAYLAVIIELIIISVSYILFFRKTTEGSRRKYRNFFIVMISLFVIIILIFLFFPGNPYVSRLTSVIFSGNNPRWILWQDSFNIFKKYPITGPGIAMFPAAFEEFYSARLRSEDVLRFADNPHNNFFQVLYTMGILGLTAYLLIILKSIRVCIKHIQISIFNNDKFNSKNSREPVLYLSFLAMLGGYCVYGLTNFDEITISLYFFVFLSMLREIDSNSTVRKVKVSQYYRTPIAVFSLVLALFLCFNAYDSVNAIRADRYFLEGEKNFASRKYSEGVNKVNESIRLSDSNPVYKLMLAINVYEMLIANKQISGENRTSLLKQAADNVIRARRNHYNKNRCDAVLSLIYFETGRNDEAERIKNEVLAGDPVNISYRLSLTLHYTEANDLSSAKDQLEAVLGTNYNAMNVWSVAAYFYERTNNFEEAKKYCHKILAADPQNRYAAEFLMRHK